MNLHNRLEQRRLAHLNGKMTFSTAGDEVSPPNLVSPYCIQPPTEFRPIGFLQVTKELGGETVSVPLLKHRPCQCQGLARGSI